MFQILPNEIVNIILINTFVNSHVLILLNLIHVCKTWKNIIYTKKLIIHNNICLPIQTKIHSFVYNRLPYTHVSRSLYKPYNLLFIKYMPLYNKNQSKLFLHVARQLLFNGEYNNNYVILTEFRIQVNNLIDNIDDSFYRIYMSDDVGWNLSNYILIWDMQYHIPKNHIKLYFKNKHLNQHEIYIINEIFTNEKFINYMKTFNMSINEYKN